MQLYCIFKRVEGLAQLLNGDLSSNNFEPLIGFNGGNEIAFNYLTTEPKFFEGV